MTINGDKWFCAKDVIGALGVNAPTSDYLNQQGVKKEEVKSVNYAKTPGRPPLSSTRRRCAGLRSARPSLRLVSFRTS